MNNPFNAYKTLETAAGKVGYFSLPDFAADNNIDLSKLPFSIKVLLEAVLRNCDDYIINKEDVIKLANWNAAAPAKDEVAFKPARVLLQDFTGVPAVVDLAALRSAMARLGGDPKRINPLIPVDLVIDHSLQIDKFGSKDAFDYNLEKEYGRNMERYQFLRWGQDAFKNFRVVPPSIGIIHQVNLEYLAKVVQTGKIDGQDVVWPDTLVGTDSHTTMINGLGVLGWGVGGIEAEAVMLGQPVYMLTPEVVGFRVEGELSAGVTATDLVLTVTQMLREHNVVGKFVEFYGPGLANLELADRAVLANMAPEYGATMGFFPVDDETLRFMKNTGRDQAQIDLVEKYTKAQGLFSTVDGPEASYTSTLSLDMGTVETSLAGPKRPQDRIPLSKMKTAFHNSMGAPLDSCGFALDAETQKKTVVVKDEEKNTIGHGAVVIASITSCTNTSNPIIMLTAGLLAKNAVEKGLTVPSWVKTSLAPGSRVVTSYLKKAGLLEPMEKLKFNLVGYGCATCIGNSGPLPGAVADAVTEGNLVAAAVLSGNRNFEGRISPHVKANYLASPPLVIGYALAGTVDIDMEKEALGKDKDGNDVFLKDIWPTNEEVRAVAEKSVTAAMFEEKYKDVFTSNQKWNDINITSSELYQWDPASTYVREPSFFTDLTVDLPPLSDVQGGRVLAKVADSVTTDHISPAGAIAGDSPAAAYLKKNGVETTDFNSYGSRRGNHEVMMRGTFANIRLKNLLIPGSEGGVTLYLPEDKQMSIYDAAERYQQDGTPLIVLAGKDYGMGSSRDWAAKGVFLQGVKAVIAESYERIHRSNLIGMGVLPLQYKDGETSETLGLTGRETFTISGISKGLAPGSEIVVETVDEAGNKKDFTAVVRIDTPVELDYYKNGGILQTVLRSMIKA